MDLSSALHALYYFFQNLGQLGTAHRDIGHSMVERLARIVQAARFRLLVRLIEQRAIRGVGKVLHNAVERCVEQDEQTGLLDSRHILRTEDRAAAECKFEAVFLRQLFNIRGLVVAEIGFALFSENLGDFLAFLRFKVDVRINKFQSGQTRQLTADSGLAAAHKTA